MVQLMNKTKNQSLLARLEVAESFFARGKGLLGREKLDPDQGLWIKPCNNIHTFFMKFSIDCVFIDKQMKVQKVVANVSPWRLVGPVWKAYSVIELPSGFTSKASIEVGDQLYVGY